MTPARNSAPSLFPNPKSRTLTFQAVLNLGEDQTHSLKDSGHFYRVIKNQIQTYLPIHV